MAPSVSFIAYASLVIPAIPSRLRLDLRYTNGKVRLRLYFRGVPLSSHYELTFPLNFHFVSSQSCDTISVHT